MLCLFEGCCSEREGHARLWGGDMVRERRYWLDFTWDQYRWDGCQDDLHSFV